MPGRRPARHGDHRHDYVVAARTSDGFVGEGRALLEARDVFQQSAGEAVAAARGTSPVESGRAAAA